MIHDSIQHQVENLGISRKGMDKVGYTQNLYYDVINFTLKMLGNSDAR